MFTHRLKGKIMMKSDKIDSGLNDNDALLINNKVSEENCTTKVQNLPLSQIDGFEGHPFKVKEDEEFQKLVESIRNYGVLIPAMARPKGDRYELISGHRRKLACELLGLKTLPTMVREMSREEAVITMVDSNIQREHILPSEKALAYKMKLEAIKRSPGRPKNSDQVGPNLWSANIVAVEANESQTQVKRYIRLTELIPEILQMVDECKIAFNPAVEISYLQPSEQKYLLEAMECEDCTPSLSQAQRLKKLSQEGQFNKDSAFEILTEDKPNQKEKLSIPVEQLRRYFPKDYTPQQMTETIERIVADWSRKLKQKSDRDAR
jgi:ParB family chromosome partitioning protein